MSTYKVSQKEREREIHYSSVYLKNEYGFFKFTEANSKAKSSIIYN